MSDTPRQTREEYYMLMASLPALPATFTTGVPPLSRLRLEKRLEMLNEDDRRELATLQSVMWWTEVPLDRPDADMVALADEIVPSIRAAALREVVTQRLEQRTIMAALRRRSAGKPAPEPREPWGWGRWVSHIQRHWGAPAFGLAGSLPWVPRLERLLDAHDSLGLERELLTLSWTWMARAAPTRFFTFDAVALYVLRWDIIARWAEYDGQAARERFEVLVAAGLGPYAVAATPAAHAA